MDEDAVVEGEVEDVSPGTALAVRSRGNLFQVEDPVDVIDRASRVASALKDVLEQKNLVVGISGREHVLMEGWTLLGSMLGVFPVVAWTRPVEGGYEARVEARTRDGAVVGAAEASCTRSEKRWARADDFAIRSMAQTRGVSKALRMPLGYIVHLAGYNPTPAEEVADQPPKSPPKKGGRKKSGGAAPSTRTEPPSPGDHASPDPTPEEAGKAVLDRVADDEQPKDEERDQLMARAVSALGGKPVGAVLIRYNGTLGGARGYAKDVGEIPVEGLRELVAALEAS